MTALRDNACMTNTEFLLQKGGDLINSELDGRGAMEVKSALNELLLLLLQLEDLLLDGVLHDQSIHKHLPTLPNSEHAIDGLILHRFVPPRITQEHHVCGCQIQTHSARAQRHQQNLGVLG